MEHEKYMTEALTLAREALTDGEIPVGCVIADADGAIIGRGRNRREKDRSALAHAEALAIAEACKSIDNWRLSGCSLYVTLEPCPMCAGAVINARLARVVYGAKDPVAGSCGSIINLFMEDYGSRAEIIGGVLEQACSELLTSFFKTLRENQT
ncbi:MAG: nucleoside deaminase [Oscillospiraceae bacterium]|jgi:tRNA(adenine34) deaminase|nr:nucleoside deaminase [Oscillospiraceae bacterium]